MAQLFDPIKMGTLQIKNRIAMAPMTRGRAGDERIPNEVMADYYFQRSSAGLLITEATVVSQEGIGWIGSPGVYTDAMVEGWKKVTQKVKPTGAHLFLQLWHCGRASHSDFHDGELPLSASAVKLNGDSIHTPQGTKAYETPREMTKEDIKRTLNNFRQAALNAKKAGFSGVEVHGANGYLINQFLDSKSNQRTDEYGGNPENKYRFLKEVLDTVLEVWEPYQVGVRLSPNGVFNDMGSADFRETYLYVAKELNKLNLGYLHVMDGLAFGFHEKGDPMTLAEFNTIYKGLIMGNCGYEKDPAQKMIEKGDADFIAFGRPFISNPDLPERLKNDWPLNGFEDMAYWYTPGAQGYTDYQSYRT